MFVFNRSAAAVLLPLALLLAVVLWTNHENAPPAPVVAAQPAPAPAPRPGPLVAQVAQHHLDVQGAPQDAKR